MPIELDYTNPETDETHPVSYWVIDEISFHPRIFTSRIVLAGYFDAATYADADKRAFLTQEFEIVQEPLDTSITVGDSITGVYTYALAVLPFFAGGTLV